MRLFGRRPADGPPRRRTELGLIILAVLLTGALYALASLGKSASLPADIGPFLGIIFGLLAVAHVAVRFLAPAADGMLLPLAALLNGLGYVFIARLDPDLAGLQSVWTAIGIAVFVGTLAVVRRARDLERYRYSFALLGVALLMMPLLPVVGRNINGSRLWIRFGTVTFQPGEVAKIVLAVFFAAYLVEKRELLSEFRISRGRLPNPRAVGPLALAWGASLLIMIAERDLGSSLLFFALFVSMLWVATAQSAYLGVGLGLFSLGAFFAYSAFSHVKTRIGVWIDPWTQEAEQGYQLAQAAYAFGSGGFAGSGVGLGRPGNIPAATTDFIFAAIGEELGLLGTAAILVAFILMVGAGLRIALRTEQPFDKLLAAGLTTILGVQTFIIIGGVTRLVPLTGITLPFISYGGSSLLANYVLLALLLRISDDTVQRARRTATESAVLSDETVLRTA
ncbi:MAG: FtsW/RodA/SpoVE family cell cycle protein [Actinomycetota bacterium]|nr:FtsW/RodA/SpoVE family cell cycle protein [Actinomycetota bacterium]